MNNNHIIFAPLPPGCTHVIRSPTAIHAITPRGTAPYRWDPTQPTNGYNGSWIPAYERQGPGFEHAPVYARAAPLPAPPIARAIPYVAVAPAHAGVVREDWLHPPPQAPAVILPNANQPAVRAIPLGRDEAVPPGHGRFMLQPDGSYGLQEYAPAQEDEWEEEWEELEDGVDWEQVVRWNELARRMERDPASLTSSEVRRLPEPEPPLSERSWPESEVTDPELVERVERRRREREGRG